MEAISSFTSFRAARTLVSASRSASRTSFWARDSALWILDVARNRRMKRPTPAPTTRAATTAIQIIVASSGTESQGGKPDRSRSAGAPEMKVRARCPGGSGPLAFPSWSGLGRGVRNGHFGCTGSIDGIQIQPLSNAQSTASRGPAQETGASGALVLGTADGPPGRLVGDPRGEPPPQE